MNLFTTIKTNIEALFIATFGIKPEIAFNVEYPREEGVGDVTTNIAMIYTKKLSQKPQDIASALIKNLEGVSYIKSASFANPGYINIFLDPNFIRENFVEAIKNISNYGCANVGQGLKTNVEFASANPTGPVHIGHVRGSVYGDVVANLLEKNGYAVTREYYVNDAGVQIQKLTRSVFLRYLQLQGRQIEIEAGCYPGEYLIETGKKLLQKYGSNLQYETDCETIRAFAVSDMLEDIKKSLARLGVKHNIYTSEKLVGEQGYIEKALKLLENKGYIYTGTPPKPKGKPSDDWEESEQTLFKSTLFGDDEDRVVKKNNGENTYFSGDIGYHLHKIERGFGKIILPLGADHLGYVKRLTAIVKGLDETCDIAVKLCQLVKFVKNGEQIKMSKRKGTFETLEDVLDEVDPSIIRFIMVSKKNDLPMEFDLEKVKQTSKDNEIFYIQYAYSRACSVFRQFEGNFEKVLQEGSYNINLLQNQHELDFIKKVLEYPKIIQIALKNLEPHHICFYLYSLASEFHKLWHFGNENEALRFIVKDNPTLTNTRLLLVFAMQNVIKLAFKIIGIEPLQTM